jgi:hypothetical protein
MLFLSSRSESDLQQTYRGTNSLTNKLANLFHDNLLNLLIILLINFLNYKITRKEQVEI